MKMVFECDKTESIPILCLDIGGNSKKGKLIPVHIKDEMFFVACSLFQPNSFFASFQFRDWLYDVLQDYKNEDQFEVLAPDWVEQEITLAVLSC